MRTNSTVIWIIIPI